MKTCFESLEYAILKNNHNENVIAIIEIKPKENIKLKLEKAVRESTEADKAELDISSANAGENLLSGFFGKFNKVPLYFKVTTIDGNDNYEEDFTLQVVTVY